MQWRLGQDEAVVLIGRSPPRTKYWSITSYLMSQFYDANTSPRIKQANFSSWIQEMAVSCKPDVGPGRCQKFASLAQPFNNIVGGYNQPFALIMTSSLETYEMVKRSIQEHASDITTIQLVPLPADLLALGVRDDDRDLLTMLMRIAYPDNEEEMSKYFEETPISVLRVTPLLASSRGAPSTRYYGRDDVVFFNRVTGVQEAGGGEAGGKGHVTHEQLLEDLKVLEAGIRQAHGNSAARGAARGGGRKSHNLRPLNTQLYPFMHPFFTTGIDCIDDGTECNGDTADTLYPISSNIYTAQLCVTIPVITIGVGVTVLLTLVCSSSMYLWCQQSSCSGKNMCVSKKFDKIDPSVTVGGVSSGGASSGSTVRHLLRCRQALASFFLSAFLSCCIAVPITLMIWSSSCDSGHAATIDSVTEIFRFGFQ